MDEVKRRARVIEISRGDGESERDGELKRRERWRDL